MHCLIDTSAEDKERLLNVQMAFSIGQPATSLLQQAVSKLIQSHDSLTNIGILMFLISWAGYCPKVVTNMMKQSDFIPYVT